MWYCKYNGYVTKLVSYQIVSQKLVFLSQNIIFIFILITLPNINLEDAVFKFLSVYVVFKCKE